MKRILLAALLVGAGIGLFRLGPGASVFRIAGSPSSPSSVQTLPMDSSRLSAERGSGEPSKVVSIPGDAMENAPSDDPVPQNARLNTGSESKAPVGPGHSEPSWADPGTDSDRVEISVGSDREERNSPPGSGVREEDLPAFDVADLLAGADFSDPEQRARIVARMEAAETARYAAVLERAEKMGIPVRKTGPDQQVSILHDFRGDEPLYRTTKNRNAGISSGASALKPAPYSLNGSGIRVGIWDAGSVRATHQELVGRVTNRNSSVATDAHSTHVAGTIGAVGVQANALGMAPAILLDAYDWNSDYTEMTAAGAATAGQVNRIPISNHSYGYEALTADMGRYETEARSLDAVAASLPYYLIFWAAGNEQDELTAKNGYQSITFTALAKNVLTVGAVHDAVSGGVRSLSAATMSYFSSWGPCDDGRIKPDVVANGVTLYSSVNTGNSAYDTYSGTSMATPSAAGSAALVAQEYARAFSGQYMRASLLKALLVHTADDLGPAGPDYQFGWGLINVKAAVDVLRDHASSLASPKLIEDSLTGTIRTRTHTFIWDQTRPIRATLCWTDPAGAAQTAPDSRTPNLVHNLDLTLTAPDGTTLYRPYVMPFVGVWTDASMSQTAVRGKNNVDNLERVDLETPLQSGVYTVTVSLDGSLTTSSQSYSLVITGGVSVEA
ncbi:MAG: S8 family serine peptidase, partial [Kiritimatiellia bacterium]|nr:S8 family serine peptidase [Kiritimatiellia bacterium]